MFGASLREMMMRITTTTKQQLKAGAWDLRCDDFIEMLSAAYRLIKLIG